MAAQRAPRKTPLINRMHELGRQLLAAVRPDLADATLREVCVSFGPDLITVHVRDEQILIRARDVEVEEEPFDQPARGVFG